MLMQMQQQLTVRVQGRENCLLSSKAEKIPVLGAFVFQDKNKKKNIVFV